MNSSIFVRTPTRNGALHCAAKYTIYPFVQPHQQRCVFNVVYSPLATSPPNFPKIFDEKHLDEIF